MRCCYTATVVWRSHLPNAILSRFVKTRWQNYSLGSAGWWSISSRGWASGYRPRCLPLECWPIWFSCTVENREPSERFAACENAYGLSPAAEKRDRQNVDNNYIQSGTIIATWNQLCRRVQLQSEIQLGRSMSTAECFCENKLTNYPWKKIYIYIVL